MKKSLPIILVLLLFISFSSSAQTKYFTRNGKVTFNASSPMENIEAVNDKASSVFDPSTGQLEFSALMKAFYFERALMQEHFNENYVESDKYPKATFKGSVSDPSSLNLAKDGTYTTKVTGKLTMHGVTRDVETMATFLVKNGVVSAASDLKIESAQYNIEIPSLVKDKIAKTISIHVQVNYEVLKSS
jgi:hypothetical protein